jgi:hypothetical protein
MQLFIDWLLFIVSGTDNGCTDGDELAVRDKDAAEDDVEMSTKEFTGDLGSRWSGVCMCDTDCLPECDEEMRS